MPSEKYTRLLIDNKSFLIIFTTRSSQLPEQLKIRPHQQADIGHRRPSDVVLHRADVGKWLARRRIEQKPDVGPTLATTVGTWLAADG